MDQEAYSGPQSSQIDDKKLNIKHVGWFEAAALGGNLTAGDHPNGGTI